MPDQENVLRVISRVLSDTADDLERLQAENQRLKEQIKSIRKLSWCDKHGNHEYCGECLAEGEKNDV